MATQRVRVLARIVAHSVCDENMHSHKQPQRARRRPAKWNTARTLSQAPIHHGHARLLHSQPHHLRSTADPPHIISTACGRPRATLPAAFLRGGQRHSLDRPSPRPAALPARPATHSTRGWGGHGIWRVVHVPAQRATASFCGWACQSKTTCPPAQPAALPTQPPSHHRTLCPHHAQGLWQAAAARGSAAVWVRSSRKYIHFFHAHPAHPQPPHLPTTQGTKALMSFTWPSGAPTALPHRHFRSAKICAKISL